jgi:NTE family protein
VTYARAVAVEPDQRGDVGLVLAGGGARGAYEIGALSVLLPELAKNGEEDLPKVLVGTSAGAINTAWLASNAHRLTDSEHTGALLEEGEQIWGEMTWKTAVKSLLSVSQARIGLKLFLGFLRLRGIEGTQLLDPSPLRDKLEKGDLSSKLKGGIDFGRIVSNVSANGPLRSAAVVGTRADTSLSVVFHTSAAGSPPYDPERCIAYAETPLRVDHVMASAAIPIVFPAVPIEDPRIHVDGWYFDGGTRLNTPIKPALELGARRLIIIALNSPWLDDPSGPGAHKYPSDGKGPAALDGIASIIQSVLVDPLVNDLHDLARTNEDLEALRERPAVAPPGQAVPNVDRRVIPYILIAPPHPDTIGCIAAKVFKESHPRGSVRFIGKRIDAGRDAARGELLSYFFFASAFAKRLIQQGKDDAQAWIDCHGDDLWQTEPLTAHRRHRSHLERRDP